MTQPPYGPEDMHPGHRRPGWNPYQVPQPGHPPLYGGGLPVRAVGLQGSVVFLAQSLLQFSGATDLFPHGGSSGTASREAVLRQRA